MVCMTLLIILILVVTSIILVRVLVLVRQILNAYEYSNKRRVRVAVEYLVVDTSTGIGAPLHVKCSVIESFFRVSYAARTNLSIGFFCVDTTFWLGFVTSSCSYSARLLCLHLGLPLSRKYCETNLTS